MSILRTVVSAVVWAKPYGSAQSRAFYMDADIRGCLCTISGYASIRICPQYCTVVYICIADMHSTTHCLNGTLTPDLTQFYCIKKLNFKYILKWWLFHTTRAVNGFQTETETAVFGQNRRKPKPQFFMGLDTVFSYGVIRPRTTSVRSFRQPNVHRLSEVLSSTHSLCTAAAFMSCPWPLPLP